MDTTARDTTRSTTSGGPVKPQRGTSPSNTKTPSTHSNSRTPNTSNTLKKTTSTTSSNNSSSDRKVRTPQSAPASASSSTKNVPNYLKSTAASRHDAYVPKKSDHDTHNKQQQSNQTALERRRSFDKPPSPSRITKAITSPGGAGSSRLPARSSSFSPRTTTTTSTNANQKLFTKTPLVKSQQGFSSSKSLKSKSGIATTKKDSTKKKSIKDKHDVDNNNTESNETDHEEDRSTVKSGGGDVLSVATSDDLNYEIDHEDNKTVTTDHESVGDFSECSVDREVEIENYDQSTDHHPYLDEIEGLAIESDLDESKIDDAIVDHEKLNVDHEKLNVDNNEDKSAINEANSETDHKEIKLQHEEENINNNNDNEDQAKESSVDDTEVINTDLVLEEVKALPPPVVTSPPVQDHGKKESPVGYNEVIEETASRLLEKRKNKVKALVGAFETVIDYETAANSPHNKS